MDTYLGRSDVPTNTLLGPTVPPLCGACQNISYCDKACQTTDWPTHKNVCKPYSQCTTSSRPGRNHRRVLVFDVAASKPQFEWLAVTPDCKEPLAQGQFFDGGGTTRMYFEDSRLMYSVHLWQPLGPSPFASGGPNRAMDRLLGAEAAGVYRGTFIVVAYGVTDGGKNRRIVDAGCDVLQPVKQHLELRAGYKGPIFIAQPQERGPTLIWNT